MLDAAIRALTQMFSPPFRAVLLKSVGFALVLIALIGFGLHRVLVWFADAGENWAESVLGTSAHMPLTILAWMLSIAAGLGIIVGSIFLMPAVTALVASFFVDEIALEVERSEYPDEPIGVPLPMFTSLLVGVKAALLAVLVYLLAVPFLLFAGFGFVLFFVATAYLLSREYFELAAMRYRPPAEAQSDAQGKPEHGLRRRPVDRRLRFDSDRQSRHAAVRHGADGAHAQAAVAAADRATMPEILNSVTPTVSSTTKAYCSSQSRRPRHALRCRRPRRSRAVSWRRTRYRPAAAP